MLIGMPGGIQLFPCGRRSFYVSTPREKEKEWKKQVKMTADLCNKSQMYVKVHKIPPIRRKAPPLLHKNGFAILNTMKGLKEV